MLKRTRPKRENTSVVIDVVHQGDIKQNCKQWRMHDDINEESILKAFSEYPSLSMLEFAAHGIFPEAATSLPRNTKLYMVIMDLIKKGLIKREGHYSPERWEITEKGKAMIKNNKL